MARSKSSTRWLREHFTDEYVRRAQAEGYRSRAVYKLLEIQEKDRLLRPGATVVDLGAAPGGWSQLAARLVGPRGAVIALDILPIEPLAGVECIQGDFRETAVLEGLLNALNGRPVDLVISDMAPNTTGIKAVDQPRGMYLAELALDFADNVCGLAGISWSRCFRARVLIRFLGNYVPRSPLFCPASPKRRVPAAPNGTGWPGTIVGERV